MVLCVAPSCARRLFHPCSRLVSTSSLLVQTYLGMLVVYRQLLADAHQSATMTSTVSHESLVFLLLLSWIVSLWCLATYKKGFTFYLHEMVPMFCSCLSNERQTHFIVCHLFWLETATSRQQNHLHLVHNKSELRLRNSNLVESSTENWLKFYFHKKNWFRAWDIGIGCPWRPLVLIETCNLVW